MISLSIWAYALLAWGDGSLWDGLHGTLTLGTYHHFEHSPQEKHDTRLQANLRLEFSGKWGENLRYFATPRVYGDNMSWASGTVDEVAETSQKRFILDLEEAYLSYGGGNFDLTLGRKVFGWGVADFTSPVDNLNPLDVIDVPTAEKMGVFSASLNYSNDKFEFEAVAVPWYSPSRLPSGNSRWLGDFREAQDRFGDVPLILLGRELPSNTPENSSYAARLSSSSLISGWDLALTFYDGIDPIGVLRGALVPQGIALAQVFPKFQEYGALFSTTVGSTEFHGEAGWHNTDDNDMDDDYLEYILGMNHTFYNLPKVEETFLILEYADERITTDKNPLSFFSGSGEYVRPFKGSWIASLQFKFNEENTLRITGLRNQGSHDGFVRGEFIHKFNDTFKLEVGVDTVDGDPESFFGRWRNNDRAYLKLLIYK